MAGWLYGRPSLATWPESPPLFFPAHPPLPPAAPRPSPAPPASPAAGRDRLGEWRLRRCQWLLLPQSSTRSSGDGAEEEEEERFL